MTAISNLSSYGTSATAATTQSKTANAATAFIVSQTLAGISSSVRKDLLNNFYDKGKAQEFVAATNKWLAQKDPLGRTMPLEVAQMNALVDVITAHREDFSPDEFTLGKPGSMTIQSAAMISADIFKRQVDAKQSDYDADQAAKDAKPDPDGAKLDALNQALQKLLPNGDVPTDGDVTDAKTAYAVLTKKLYPDDGHDPNNSDTSNDDTTASPITAPDDSQGIAAAS